MKNLGNFCEELHLNVLGFNGEAYTTCLDRIISSNFVHTNTTVYWRPNFEGNSLAYGSYACYCEGSFYLSDLIFNQNSDTVAEIDKLIYTMIQEGIKMYDILEMIELTY